MAATPKIVDMTNVKEAGQFRPTRVPEGDYPCEIVAVDDHLKDGEKVSVQWVFTIKIKGKRGTYPYYVNHTDPKYAWKIRNLCLAVGLAAPKKRVKVDPNKLVGRELGAAFEDDEFEGRKKSQITAVFPVAEISATPQSESTVDSVDDVEDDTDEVDDLDLEEV